MKAEIRMPRRLVDRVQHDLRRKHPFAHERVGFLSCRTAALDNDDVLLMPVAYHPLQDDEYVRSKEAGAMMNEHAIGKAMQLAYKERVSIIHVHEHSHSGKPGFSRIDVTEGRSFMPDFFNASPHQPHGLMVLSHDYANALVWRPGQDGDAFASVTIVGAPMRFIRAVQ